MARGIQCEYSELGPRDGSGCTVIMDNTTGEMTGTQIIKTSWDEHFQARKDILGYPTYDPDTGALSRHLPMTHPQEPILRATRVSVRGLGWVRKKDLDDGYGSTNEYTDCELKIDYTVPKYSIYEDDEISSEFSRYVEIEPRVNGEYLQYPAFSKLQFVGLTGPEGIVAANPGKIIGTVDYTFRWREVPYDYLNPDAYLRALGRVNSEEFANEDDPPLVFNPEKLLFVGAGWRLRTLANGDYGWDVEFLMRYNRKGHNYLFNYLTDPPAWYQVSINGVARPEDGFTDEQSIYGEQNFYDLFLPPI